MLDVTDISTHIMHKYIGLHTELHTYISFYILYILPINIFLFLYPPSPLRTFAIHKAKEIFDATAWNKSSNDEEPNQPSSYVLHPGVLSSFN